MDKNQIREVIARRAALELKDGDVVNLGIGLPTMIPDFLPEGVSVILQSENGLVGMGPTPKPGEENPDLINSGGGYITETWPTGSSPARRCPEWAEPWTCWWVPARSS